MIIRDYEAERLKLAPDIQEAAANSYNAPLLEGEALWQMLPDYYSDPVLLAIGNAVLAERDRCIALVQAFQETTTEGRAELVAQIAGNGVPS